MLAYSGGTDRPGGLCCVTQMINFPSWILDHGSQSPGLLDFFFLLMLVLNFTMAFAPLAISDQVVLSVSINFLSNSPWNAPFHCIAYDYSHADWDNLCDHERCSMGVYL